MRIPSTDQVDLAVHDLGGEGPPLLLAHATGFHGQMWGPLAAALAPRFHCWSFDFRGHGDSSRPVPPDYDWRGFGDDALAVVDGLRLRRPFGLGHSQGGTAFLLAEQSRPATFEALYLYEPVAYSSEPPPPPMDDHPLVTGALRRHDRFDSTDAAVRRLGAKPPLADFHPEVLRAYVDHGVTTFPDGEVGLKCQRDDEAQVYRMGPSNPAFDHLGAVACPVILARGSSTEAVSVGLAKRQVARLPRGRMEVLDGLGHFGPLEDPARVADAVITALSPYPRL